MSHILSVMFGAMCGYLICSLMVAAKGADRHDR